jgi:hypothetical protein
VEANLVLTILWDGIVLNVDIYVEI